jgi:hypothetical protein
MRAQGAVALEAGEILGVSERQFRCYRRHYEEDGVAGLVDRGLGKESARRVLVDRIAWMLGFAGRNGPRIWTACSRNDCGAMVAHFRNTDPGPSAAAPLDWLIN